MLRQRVSDAKNIIHRILSEVHSYEVETTPAQDPIPAVDPFKHFKFL